MISAGSNSHVAVEYLICDDRNRCRDCDEPECIDKARAVRLLKDITYSLPGTGILVIKAGFVFDGASIPPAFWATKGHPLDHSHIRSSLLHDGLYAAQVTDRATADRIFLDFMGRADCVPWYTRSTIYVAVRVFGGGAWRHKTPGSIARACELISLIPAAD
jgi:hypothetical protein